MYRYDQKLAQRVIDFFGHCLCHVKGELAGQPIKLEDWQIQYLTDLFGIVDERGRRRYRRSFLAVPRKNGKSTLCAGIALYLLLADGEPGAEVYSCAADREQASIVHEIARQMLMTSPRLYALARPYQHRIVCESTGSFYSSLSSDAYTHHGLNSHGVLFDELHAQKTPDLWDVMITSTGARRQPLVVAITTAGWDRNSVCWQEWQYAANVRDGVIQDDQYLSCIYAADPSDDWKSEQTWHKANPNLGVSVKLEYLRQKCSEAQELPRLENTFRQLHLNQWTEQAVRWLPMDAWDACGELEVPDLVGRECYVGVDLASNRDITAAVFLFPLEDRSYAVVPHFWVPRNPTGARQKQDALHYATWLHEGHIIATEGDVTDYGAVENFLVESSKVYQINEVAIDRWNSQNLQTDLKGHGLNVVTFGQGFASMSGPSRELERIVLGRRLRHGRNPVLRWMASNAAADTDAAGNIKPTKERSTGKIDGIVGLLMALGRAMVHETVIFDDQKLIAL